MDENNSCNMVFWVKESLQTFETFIILNISDIVAIFQQVKEEMKMVGGKGSTGGFVYEIIEQINDIFLIGENQRGY